MTTRTPIARAQRAALWVGTLVPLALLSISVIVQLVWLPRMPDPAATHWGPSGLPDGFGAPWTNVFLFASISLAALVLPPLQRFQLRRGDADGAGRSWAAANRWMPAFTLGMVVSLQLNALGTAWVQLDAVDASETGSTLGWLLGGWLAGAVVCVAAYLVQPSLRIDPEEGEPAARALPLEATERAAWVGEIRPSRGVGWALVAVNVLLAAMAAWMLTVEPLAGWIGVGTLAVVAAGTVMCMWFSVRIGPQGLEARSLVGWPVFRIAAADVADVVTARIEPLGEFGGWGLRFAGGRTGLVPRGGEGLVITRRNGKVLVATLDGAEEAAAVLVAAARAAGPTTDPAAQVPDAAETADTADATDRPNLVKETRNDAGTD